MLLTASSLLAILTLNQLANGLQDDAHRKTFRKSTKKQFMESVGGIPVHNVKLQPAPVYVDYETANSDNNNYSYSVAEPVPVQKAANWANGAYGFIDDVFADEEANEMQQYRKRGMNFMDPNNGGGSYSYEFIETHKQFLSSLLTQPSYAIPDISEQWRAYPGERSYRTSKLYTRWKSVDCSALDMRLKMVGTIYDGVKNRVIKLYDSVSKRTFAYKTYSDPDEFYAELEVFMWLDHPYFVKPHCHRKDTATGRAGILFDYVDGKPSHQYARDASPEQLRFISAQLLVAIEHLHYLGILHADLKPENVIIRNDGTVQVIDMGFAVHLPQVRRGRGTRTTMAPELVNLVPGKVHEAIDWWAYGSTVAMWYGNNRAYSSDESKRFVPMYVKDRKYTAGTVPWRFDSNLRSFLHIFFQAHPETRRLNTKRLLKQLRAHPFFDNFDWSQVHGGWLD